MMIEQIKQDKELQKIFAIVVGRITTSMITDEMWDKLENFGYHDPRGVFYIEHENGCAVGIDAGALFKDYIDNVFNLGISDNPVKLAAALQIVAKDIFLILRCFTQHPTEQFEEELAKIDFPGNVTLQVVNYKERNDNVDTDDTDSGE